MKALSNFEVFLSLKISRSQWIIKYKIKFHLAKGLCSVHLASIIFMQR